MRPHPPEPLIVHVLPPAPEFVGRDDELESLCARWAAGQSGVLALVGLGGAGKTALAARFLGELRQRKALPRPSGLFVWSFYQEPDAGLFLREAVRYFAGETATASPAQGAGLLHLLRDALGNGGPHLLVLDGLERVQQQGGTDGAGHGKIEDPLLRGLLTRISEGMGRTTALITSRFPLSDLEPTRGRGYAPVDVGGLDRLSAIDLLHRRGVLGDDAVLGGLVDSYGAHALTLDHLGGLIGQFLGGDPGRAPEAPSLPTATGDRQAIRLARLLRAYEDHLPAAELALLSRLCLVRSGATEAQLERLFVCTPPLSARSARDAVALLLSRPEPLDIVPDLRKAVHDAIAENLCDAPHAGPADEFAAEVRQTVENVFARPELIDDEHVEATIQVYADGSLDAQTEQRPLSGDERALVRQLGKLYRDLRAHPLSPFKPKHHDALQKSLQHLGWDVPQSPLAEDLGPADIRRQLTRVAWQIRQLVLKHHVLRRVRELCRLRQQKWTLAGPLATADAAAMRRLLAALVDRHLVLRESDGSVSVHPAVRDHFARLGDGSSRESWHDLIREQLVSLVRRPGRRLPEDKQSLDLVEEAIYHALEAGKAQDASFLYERGLGGLRHLGWKLGEVSRGLRILRGFPACPDSSGLSWFLRGLGELDEAYLANSMPYFRADVRLLQGRLPEVAAEGDSVRAAIATFLMGIQTTPLPPDVLGLAVPRAQLLLFLGRLQQVWQGPQLGQLYGQIGWEGDRARVQLFLAEAARRQADPESCRQHLEAASSWVLHSGSVEHLCLWHLVRSRVERDTGDLAAARRAVDEGVHMARNCGLGLDHVLLLNARAEILHRADPETAEESAREALQRATAPQCLFRWGAGEAGHLLGHVLSIQWKHADARAVLKQALAQRRAIGDPRAEQTQALLAKLPS